MSGPAPPGAGRPGTVPAEVTLEGPASLTGSPDLPGDKSISHRAILLAALADGTSTLTNVSEGADVAATGRIVRSFGATVERPEPRTWRIGGTRPAEPPDVCDCGNSGTTIRLVAGVAATIPGLTVLTGDASLRRRPMDRVAEPLRRMGAVVDGREGGRLAPLVVRGGPLRGITHRSPVASGQIKSAVLLAGLAADGPTTVVEPGLSRVHTEEMLEARGISVQRRRDGDLHVVTVQPGRPAPADERIPADPSQAAFWVVAALICPDSAVEVRDVYLGPGRSGFLDVLARMGADLEVDRATGTIRARTSVLAGTTIEPAEVPGLVDEIPVLAVAAARAAGETDIVGAGELRFKESDRIRSVARMLAAFGVDVTELPDGLRIRGATGLRPGRVDAAGDHRIAMAAAVAALCAPGTSTISGFDSVATSYPGFLEDLGRLRTGGGG